MRASQVVRASRRPAGSATAPCSGRSARPGSPSPTDRPCRSRGRPPRRRARPGRWPRRGGRRCWSYPRSGPPGWSCVRGDDAGSARNAAGSPGARALPWAARRSRCRSPRATPCRPPAQRADRCVRGATGPRPDPGSAPPVAARSPARAAPDRRRACGPWADTARGRPPGRPGSPGSAPDHHDGRSPDSPRWGSARSAPRSPHPRHPRRSPGRSPPGPPRTP